MKAYIYAYSWLSENLAIFRITVKDSAAMDVAGMFIPIRLIPTKIGIGRGIRI